MATVQAVLDKMDRAIGVVQALCPGVATPLSVWLLDKDRQQVGGSSSLGWHKSLSESILKTVAYISVRVPDLCNTSHHRLRDALKDKQILARAVEYCKMSSVANTLAKMDKVIETVSGLYPAVQSPVNVTLLSSYHQQELASSNNLGWHEALDWDMLQGVGYLSVNLGAETVFTEGHDRTACRKLQSMLSGKGVTAAVRYSEENDTVSVIVRL